MKLSPFSKTCLFGIVFSFLIPINTFAAAGCCSHHGGVKGCNGKQQEVCADGTVSPTCLCNGEKTKIEHERKVGKGQPYTRERPSTKTYNTHKTHEKNHKTIVPPVVPVATKAKTTGCCSRHGGVAQCDKKTGFQKCKDGTLSTTCKCE
jgi:hypothetical protein